MLRPFVQYRLIFVAALALMTIASPNVGVQAQDVGAVAAPSPEVTTAAVVADASASTAPPATVAPPQATVAVTQPVTEAPTVQPTSQVVEAAKTSPVVTEAVKTTTTPTSTPTSTPVTKDAIKPAAPTAARVSTDTSTTLPPAVAQSSVPQVTSQSSATIPSEPTSPRNDIPDNGFENNLRGIEAEAGSNMRGSGDEGPASASSLSSSSNSASEFTTGTPTVSISTETVVFFMLGGIGLTIIMSLLFVFWRNRSREDPDLGTPVAPDTTTTTFPAASMPSIVAPTARELSAWKASGSTFTSRDLPLSANTRAKLNAITRLSTDNNMVNRQSHVTILPVGGSLTQALRQTNGPSDQSFSIRGYSELSIHHVNDLESETPAMTYERDSGSDGYSSGDRYSASGKYSASSRLSSDPGRSSSGWSQLQASKNVDIPRYSSTSSTSSSIVARNLNPAPWISQDDSSGTDAPDTKDSTTSRTSRTDVPNWYSVIESPTDIGRYTASSLESDTISNTRESYEL